MINYYNLNIRDKKYLKHILKVACKVTGAPQCPLKNIFDQQILRTIRSILDSTTPPLLYLEFVFLPLGCRFRVTQFRCNRSKNSLISFE